MVCVSHYIFFAFPFSLSIPENSKQLPRPHGLPRALSPFKEKQKKTAAPVWTGCSGQQNKRKVTICLLQLSPESKTSEGNFVAYGDDKFLQSANTKLRRAIVVTPVL